MMVFIVVSIQKTTFDPYYLTLRDLHFSLSNYLSISMLVPVSVFFQLLFKLMNLPFSVCSLLARQSLSKISFGRPSLSES